MQVHQQRKRGNGPNSNQSGNGQSIAQNCEQSQNSSLVTAGANSPVKTLATI